VLLSSPFTFELLITDISNTKRRILFSTNTREVARTPLHCRIPCMAFIRGSWLNICIDIVDVCNFCFPGQTFRSTEAFVVSAICRLRRIFTLRDRPRDTGEDKLPENIPRQLDFPAPCSQTQLIDSATIVDSLLPQVNVAPQPPWKPPIRKKAQKSQTADVSPSPMFSINQFQFQEERLQSGGALRYNQEDFSPEVIRPVAT